jgi:hypothetical protein
MRKDFLSKEFQAIADLEIEEGEDIESSIRYITAAEFRQRYGLRVIERSEKVDKILKGVEDQVEHGLSNGQISFVDFSYMYMFLEFNDKKVKKKTKRKGS